MDPIKNPFSPGPGAPPPELAGRYEVLEQTHILPSRPKLINKGMTCSPSHGNMAFTVPLFDEFVRRAMPEFDAHD